MPMALDPTTTTATATSSTTTNTTDNPSDASAASWASQADADPPVDLLFDPRHYEEQVLLLAPHCNEQQLDDQLRADALDGEADAHSLQEGTSPVSPSQPVSSSAIAQDSSVSIHSQASQSTDTDLTSNHSLHGREQQPTHQHQQPHGQQQQQSQPQPQQHHNLQQRRQDARSPPGSPRPRSSISIPRYENLLRAVSPHRASHDSGVTIFSAHHLLHNNNNNHHHHHHHHHHHNQTPHHGNSHHGSSRVSLDSAIHDEPKRRKGSYILGRFRRDSSRRSSTDVNRAELMSSNSSAASVAASVAVSVAAAPVTSSSPRLSARNGISRTATAGSSGRAGVGAEAVDADSSTSLPSITVPPLDVVPEFMRHALRDLAFNELKAQAQDEYRRFVLFEKQQRAALASRYEQARAPERKWHLERVAALEQEHAQMIDALEEKQVSREYEFHNAHAEEKLNVQTALKHMEAYCNDSANRTVTDEDREKLRAQYRVRDTLDTKHTSAINVLRQKQERVIKTRLQIQRQELKALADNLEQSLAGSREEEAREKERFQILTDARRKRLVERWDLRLLKWRKEYEKAHDVSLPGISQHVVWPRDDGDLSPTTVL